MLTFVIFFCLTVLFSQIFVYFPQEENVNLVLRVFNWKCRSIILYSPCTIVISLALRGIDSFRGCSSCHGYLFHLVWTDSVQLGFRNPAGEHMTSLTTISACEVKSETFLCCKNYAALMIKLHVFCFNKVDIFHVKKIFVKAICISYVHVCVCVSCVLISNSMFVYFYLTL